MTTAFANSFLEPLKHSQHASLSKYYLNRYLLLCCTIFVRKFHGRKTAAMCELNALLIVSWLEGRKEKKSGGRNTLPAYSASWARAMKKSRENKDLSHLHAFFGAHRQLRLCLKLLLWMKHSSLCVSTCGGRTWRERDYLLYLNFVATVELIIFLGDCIIYIEPYLWHCQ